jgi:7-cyano-7-deazaguanine synthase
MEPRKIKAVCLLSGGMDSTTCVAQAASLDMELFLLHVNYGQRTERRELEAFLNVADFYSVPRDNRLLVGFSHLKQIGGSALTDYGIPVPVRSFGQMIDDKEIPKSYVPFRNAHILSIAVSWGEVIGADFIFIGAVEEDSSGYPDCRYEYYKAFNELIKVGTKRGDLMQIVTPLIHLKKEEIVKRAMELGAPLHLTWSCYQNEDKACGVCDSCLLRLKGFQNAGIEDRILYMN